jgi:hypothetical protein
MANQCRQIDPPFPSAEHLSSSWLISTDRLTNPPECGTLCPTYSTVWIHLAHLGPIAVHSTTSVFNIQRINLCNGQAENLTIHKPTTTRCLQHQPQVWLGVAETEVRLDVQRTKPSGCLDVLRRTICGQLLYLLNSSQT